MTMLGQGASVHGPAPAEATPLLGEKPIRVMIVDDSAVVRGLVSRWIGEEAGLETVARHANGRQAVEDVARSAPDIILLDGNPLEGIQYMLKTKVVLKGGKVVVDKR